jgi:hypothetical protein
MAYTTIKDPSAHFQTALYTGNGSTQSITNNGGSDLKPDFVWIKNRQQYQHQAYDSNRGVHKKLLVSNTDDESTDTNALTSFNTDGFSTGSNVGVNMNNVNHVAWQWKANGGTTSSNTDGSLTSTVQANQDAGFSISTYTTADTNETVGHGLGVAPEVIIVKRRDADGYYWPVLFPFLTTTNKQMYLNATNVIDSVNIDSPGASTFRVFGWPGTATANATFVAYCFASKQGYSKFGSYIANASADGPFIYTGFKPAWILRKATTRTEPWMIIDNKRNPSNVAATSIEITSNGESTTADYDIDFVSNGFKVRSGSTSYGNHTVGTKYIYMAFAESPFVAGGVPTTAR